MCSAYVLKKRHFKAFNLFHCIVIALHTVNPLNSRFRGFCACFVQSHALQRFRGPCLSGGSGTLCLVLIPVADPARLVGPWFRFSTSDRLILPAVSVFRSSRFSKSRCHLAGGFVCFGSVHLPRSQSHSGHFFVFSYSFIIHVLYTYLNMYILFIFLLI